jgi:hypothetical protein
MAPAISTKLQFAVLPAFALIAVASLSQPLAANEMMIDQVVETRSSTSNETGNTAEIIQKTGNNTAAIRQDAVPNPSQAASTLGIDNPDKKRFQVFSPDDLPSSGETKPLAEGEIENSTSLAELLENFEAEGIGFGEGNTATITQRNGSGNRALAVQAGADNRLETIQNGSNNLGIHLQKGSDNDTLLRQTGDGNVNALIARGDVYSKTQGTVELNVDSQNGSVKGFAVSAQGPQNYSTINVSKKKQGGGLKIDVR